MNPLLIGPLFELAGKAFDKVFPDPEMAAQAKREFAHQAQTLDQAELDSFRDFMLAYEGAGDKVNPFIQTLRGSVRPVITYGLVGLYGFGFANPSAVDAAMMEMLFQLNLISLGFWYGERALKNLGLDLGKRGELRGQRD